MHRRIFTAPFHITKFGRLVQTLARLERQFTDLDSLERVRDRGACGPWRGAEPEPTATLWPCAHKTWYGHDVDCWD